MTGLKTSYFKFGVSGACTSKLEGSELKKKNTYKFLLKVVYKLEYKYLQIISILFFLGH